MLFHRTTTNSCPADSQSSDRSVLWRKRQTLSRSTPLQPPESHPSPVGEGDGPLLNSAKEDCMNHFIGTVEVTHGEYNTKCAFIFKTEEDPGKYLNQIAKSWYGSRPIKDGNNFFFDAGCVCVTPVGWKQISPATQADIHGILNVLTPQPRRLT
jgi:hypothetical protein